jgi:MSHA biogenesis protein MshG
MAAFKYIGRDAQGKQVSGTLDGVDASAIAEQLTRRSIIPVAIDKLAANRVASGESLASKDVRELLAMQQVDLEDLIIFCRQMYALMRSGVPILRAINGLSDSTNSKFLRQALVDVGGLLEGGQALSSAFNQHPKIFSPLFVAIIHVGENTGLLENAFLKLSQYFEREMETRKRIKAAVRYPIFVLLAIAVAMVIMNIFVIPTFVGMFAKFGAQLPWSTQLLIASSNFFVNYWPHLLAFMLMGGIGLNRYIASEAGRYRWDRFKMRLPVVGSIVERSLLARFSHSFAIVLRSGVPMTTGLSLVSDAVDNAYVKDKIRGIRKAIEGGESLLRAASSSGLFTPLVLQMIAVGEETGRIDELLEEVADYYEREVDYDLATLTARIEPLLIAVVAGMVLILALGIFTPMWDMMSAYKGR